MKIFAKVKIGRGAGGGAKGATSAVSRVDATHFTVSVNAPRKEGKANDAVVRALARHFGVGVSRVRIVSGLTSKEKVVEVV